MVVDRGRRGPAQRRSSTCAARSRTTARAASRGCSRSPSRPTTPRAASSTSPTPTSATPCGWSSTGARPATELRADAKSARLVLRIPQPTTKHHGGLLLFGPDKHLYIGAGDGGPSGDPGNVAQNKRLLLGKLLRIDPRRKRRAQALHDAQDNPFVGRPGRDEIFAYGLRNPWRFSFDRATGESHDRRRRQRALRGDRHPARPQGAGRELRLVGVRGQLRAEAAAWSRGDARCSPFYTYPARPRVRGHRRLRRPRPAPVADRRPRDRRPLPLRRLLHGQAVRLPRHPQRPRQAAQLPLQAPRSELIRRGPRRAHLPDPANRSRSQREGDAGGRVSPRHRPQAGRGLGPRDRGARQSWRAPVPSDQARAARSSSPKTRMPCTT